MKKSIFLSLVLILTMGGFANSLRTLATDVGGNAESCTHEQTEYENLGLTHSIKCSNCGENLEEEAHVDEDIDMCCDACSAEISNLAPSQGEGYVESELTLNESIKISISANKNEVSKIIVSSWYYRSNKNIYEIEAIYNETTGLYEAIINFADVNGENGTYNFDASIYDASGNMRYVRISEVSYTKNGISNVKAYRNEEGNIEVQVDAVEGGEIYISTNGVVPTDDSEWQTYNAGETYEVEDENAEIETVNVYYRSSETTSEDLTPTTYAVTRSTGTVIAIYSEADYSLTFYNATTVPTEGSTYNGKVATKVFDGFATSMITPWMDYATNIKSVVVHDEIAPKYMSWWFQGFSNVTSMNLSKLDTSNVINMESAFDGCGNLTTLDLSNFVTTNVKNMHSMFSCCYNLSNLNISNFDTSNVTDMGYMFWNCWNLTSLDLKHFVTTNVTDMKWMFNGSNIKNLDLSNFNTSNVTNMYCMFAYCEKLETLNLSGFDTSKVTNMTDMFDCTYKLCEITLGEKFSFNGAGTTRLTSLEKPTTVNHEDADGKWYNKETGKAYEATEIPNNTAATYTVIPQNNLSAMITEWTIPSANTTITLPVYGTVNLTIDWGDGTVSGDVTTEYPTHTYAEAGVYDITVKGTTTHWGLGTVTATNVTSSNSKFYTYGKYLTGVKQMGELEADYGFSFCSNLKYVSGDSTENTFKKFGGFNNLFWGCTSLERIDVSSWKTSNITSMTSAFRLCSALKTLDLSNWDTTNVTNFSWMFYGCTSLTNLNLDNWNTSNVGTMGNMFQNCKVLTTLNLNHFNTSLVTDFGELFSSCNALTDLNISNFDTSKATYMYAMFAECSSLKSLDVSKFNTSNVTNMSRMFMGCSKLTSITFGTNFNTSNVTNMESMFSGNTSLTSLDLSSFNTPKVTNMKSMFYYCSALKSINMSNFDTSNVTSMEYMFYFCYGLSSLDLSNFVTSNLINMKGMFHNCNQLKTLNVSSFDTSKVQTMQTTFGYCLSLEELNIKNFNTSSVTNMAAMFRDCRALKKLDVSNFNTSNVTTMQTMFYNCKLLTSLDISNFKTSKVNDMRWTFYGCSSLTDLDISNWDTSKVKGMKSMFCNCSLLGNLDLSNFDTSSITGTDDVGMPYFLYGCTNLNTLLVGNKFIPSGDVTQMFSGDTSLSSIIVIDETSSGDQFALVADQVQNATFYVPNAGLEDYQNTWSNSLAIEPIVKLNGGNKMTVALNGSYEEPGYTVVGETPENAVNYLPEEYLTLTAGSVDTKNEGTYEIKYALVKTSGDVKVASLASDFGVEGEVIAEDKRTVEVINYSKYMITEWTLPVGETTITLPLSGDVNLTVDWGDESEVQLVTTANPTHKYTNNTGEPKKYYITIKGTCDYWGSEYVEYYTPAEGDDIYTYTKYLTGLKQWGELSTQRYGFTYCSNLKYVSGDMTENTFENVRSMQNMFDGCKSLESIDLSNFDTSQIVSMQGMFAGCSALKELDVSNFKTSNVISMYNMFNGCSALTTLDLSNFNTSNVKYMNLMFRNCSSLKNLYITSFNTSNVLEMHMMFGGCKLLESINLSSFNTAKVTRTYEMFYNCSSLKSLDLSSFDTSSLNDMHYMFLGCKSLTTLNLNNFNTQNVTNMQSLFTGCSALTSLEINNWNTAKVSSMQQMFKDCSALVSLNISNFNTSSVKNMRNMFNGCSALTTLDLSNFNTSIVENMGYMFSGCKLLKTLTLGKNFITPKVSQMDYMFNGCNSLENIDVSKFDTSNVTNMAGMFAFNNSMIILDLINFDTRKVTDMTEMFNGDTDLTHLFVGENFVVPETHTDMFKDCNNLSKMIIVGEQAEENQYKGTIPETVNVYVPETAETHFESVLDGNIAKEKVEPIINLKGKKTNLITTGSTYEEPGYEVLAIDSSEIATKLPENYTVITVSDVNMGVPGIYKIKYVFVRLPDEVKVATTAEELGIEGEVIDVVERTVIVGDQEKMMVTEWTIPTDNTQIILPVSGTVNLVVDWGDGSEVQTVTTTFPTHTYSGEGTYNITIMGTCGTWGNGDITDRAKENTRYYAYENYFTGLISWGEIGVEKYGFAQCRNLEYVLDNVTEKTFENVTDMSNMFFNCNKLNSLDLYYFDTSKVTDMRYMFNYCTSLTFLNISNFNTSKVTNMNKMFEGCSNLTSLDVSSFDTSEVTSMDAMFCECSSLESIDISNFDTYKVTNMRYMFKNCKALININLRRFNENNEEVTTFDTSNVTNMSNMFDACWYLKTLDINCFNTSKVINMSNMFNNCESLISLDLSSFNTSKVTDMSKMFAECKSLKSIDLSSFNTSKVTKMDFMFFKCSAKSIDLSSFDTSKVTDMNNMFTYCSSLTSLDLSSFDTSKVSDMTEMFRHCNSLKSILVSNKFYILTANKDIFYLDNNISAIILTSKEPSGDQFASVADQVSNITFYVPNDSVSAYENAWSNSLVIEPILQLEGEEKITLEIGNDYEEPGYTVAGFGLDKSGDYTVYGYNVEVTGDVKTDTPATYTLTYDLNRKYSGDTIEEDVAIATRTVEVVAKRAFAIYSADDNSLRFYKDIMPSAGSVYKDKTVTAVYMVNEEIEFDYVSWQSYKTQIKTVVVEDIISPILTKDWFLGFNNLTSVNLSKLDTSKVKSMENMFASCLILESLDLSNFNTENVTSMESMFSRCNSLVNLNISSFNTSKVTNMAYMFYECNSLIDLDVSKFDTSNVIFFICMFSCCESLTSLNVSNFDISSTKDISYMFEECNNLTSVDISGFDTSNIEDMSGLFHNCKKLEKIDLSNFDTSNVKNMHGMFYQCYALKYLDLSMFNTANVTDMEWMLNSCVGLESILLSNEFIIPEKRNYMVDGANKLRTIIMTSKIPNATQFDDKLDILVGRTFYVPNESVDSYKEAWPVIEAIIEPLVKPKAGLEETLLRYQVYEETYCTIAGFELEDSEKYNVYGYDLKEIEGEVNSNIIGDNEVNYIVTRTKNNTLLSLDVATKLVKVIDGQKIDLYENGNIYDGNWTNQDIIAVVVPLNKNTTWLEVKVGNNEWSTDSELANISKSGDSYVVIFNQTMNASVLVREVDVNGSATTQAINQYILKIDKILPVVEKIEINNVVNSIALNAKVSDKISGIVNYSITNGEEPTSWNEYGEASGEIEKTFNENGTYYLWLKDKAGNIAKSQEIVINKDNESPTGMIEIIADNIVSGDNHKDTIVVDANKVSGEKYTNKEVVEIKIYAEDNITAKENIMFALYNEEDYKLVKKAQKEIEWQSYVESIEFELNPEDGKQKIYAIFKDEAGNMSMTYGDLDGSETDKAIFAVYSADDSSLTFYNGTAPIKGITYNGKTATEVYTDFAENEIMTTSDIPWYEQEGYIKTVMVHDEISPKSTAMWFYMMNDIESINLEKLNTSQVTTMSYMFGGCENITEIIGMENWNTENVTNMSGMFANCSYLRKLDLSSFDTSKVTTMSAMFSSAVRLEELKLGEKFAWVGENHYLNRPDPTYIPGARGVWYDIADNKAYDSFEIPSNKKATYSAFGEMSYAVYSEDDESLRFYKTKTPIIEGEVYNNLTATKVYADIENLPLNEPVDWETNGAIQKVIVEDEIKPISTSHWFHNLQHITYCDVTKLNTSKTVDMSNMFRYTGMIQDSVTLIGLDKWDTSKVENMSYMFNSLAGVNGQTINMPDISNWDTSSLVNMDRMLWPLDIDVNLKEKPLNLSKWNTSKVESMEGIFSNIDSKYIDINGTLAAWDTSNVKNMEGMFQFSEFIYLDLSNMDTSSVENMNNMFRSCNDLKQITLGEKFKWVGTNGYLPERNYSYSRPDLDGKWYDIETGIGYIPSEVPDEKLATYSETSTQAFAIYSETDNSLRVYKTNAIPNKGDIYNDKVVTELYRGIEYLSPYATEMPWKADALNIETVAIENAIAPTTIAYWFDGFENLTSLNLENLDTSNVISMKAAFRNCKALEYINLYTLDTTNVVNMSNMFEGCINLIELYLSNFNTQIVTNMSYMFANCHALQFLEIYNFDVANVRNMSHMFFMCKSLYTIDIGGWAESNVTNASAMFSNCLNLTYLYFEQFDTSNIENMSGMFSGCRMLINLDLSSFDTSNVKDVSNMFYDCVELRTINLSSFDTTNVTSMTNMFANCINLRKVTIGENFKWIGTDGYLPEPDSTIIDGADGNWYDIETEIGYKPNEVPDEKLATYAVSLENAIAIYSETDNSLSFYKTRTIPVVGTTFNNKVVTEVYTEIEESIYVFEAPWINYAMDITTVEIKNKISPVALDNWFYGFENITSIDLENLDTSNVISMYSTFTMCYNLQNIDLSKFNTTKVGNMLGMFSECRSLTSLDLSNFDTSKVVDMRDMFWGCSSLTSLNLSNFDTQNVTYMCAMFSGCINLTSLDLRNIDTSKVVDMSGMFARCESLTSLDLSSFDTTNVTNMDYMFEECLKLQEITLGKNFKWIGTAGYLPAQTSDNILNADGKWYDIETGIGYEPSEVPDEKLATYTAISGYTITFDTDGGNEIAPIKVFPGKTVIKPANPTKAGYTFTGWNPEIPEIMPEENITVKATWQEEVYQVAYNLGGGSVAETNETSYTVTDEDITLNNPSKEGYTFAGWTEEIKTENWSAGYIDETTGEAEESTEYPNSVYSEPILLQENTTYTLEAADASELRVYDLEGNYKSTETLVAYLASADLSFYLALDEKITYTAEEDCYVRIVLKEGATEEERNNTVLKSTNQETVTIKTGSTGSKTFTANYTVNQYTITFETIGGSEVAPITQDYGTTIKAPTAPTKTGYTFVGWTPSLPTTMPAENITVSATWEEKTYEVRFEANGGNIDTLGSTYTTRFVTYGKTYGEVAAGFPAAVRDGYVFLGWYTSGDVETLVSGDTVVDETAEGQVLYAHWEKGSIEAIPGIGDVIVEAEKEPEFEYNPDTGELNGMIPPAEEPEEVPEIPEESLNLIEFNYGEFESNTSYTSGEYTTVEYEFTKIKAKNPVPYKKTTWSKWLILEDTDGNVISEERVDVEIEDCNKYLSTYIVYDLTVDDVIIVNGVSGDSLITYSIYNESEDALENAIYLAAYLNKYQNTTDHHVAMWNGTNYAPVDCDEEITTIKDFTITETETIQKEVMVKAPEAETEYVYVPIGTLKAREGMTWREWLSSEYNTLGIPEPLIKTADFEDVSYDDVIIEGKDYSIVKTKLAYVAKVGDYVDYPVSYNNVEDGVTLNGWRVLGIEGDQVKLVSAGIPLKYNHDSMNTDLAIENLTTNFLKTTYEESGFESGKTLTEVFDNDYTDSVRSIVYSDVAGMTKTDLTAIPKSESDYDYAIYYLASVTGLVGPGELDCTNPIGNVGEASTGGVNGVRPVVILNSNVVTTGKNADGAWEIEVEVE